MPVDAKLVRIGTPDQLVTGAVLSAPLGTTLPDVSDVTMTGIELDDAFKDSGYVSSDGVTITPEFSTSDITDWSGAMVRRVLETFTGTIAWTMIETNEQSTKMAFGDDNVTATPATSSDGTKLKVGIGAHLPAAKSWAIKLKDGDARMLVLVPNGQITTVNEITLNATDPIGWGVELACYDDGTGNSIYIITDDGIVAAA